LQSFAVFCNVLQCVAVCLHLTRVSHLQQAEEYRVKPQRVALCWPCTVIPLSSLDYCAASVANKGKPNQASVCCSVLYSFVLCCSVLQCTSRPFCLLLTHVRCLQQAEESRIKPLRLLACTRPQPAFRRRTGQFLKSQLTHECNVQNKCKTSSERFWNRTSMPARARTTSTCIWATCRCVWGRVSKSLM